MRILLYSWNYNEAFGGGGAISSRLTAAELRKRGHEIGVATTLPEFEKALANRKPDLVLHHNTRELVEVVGRSKKAGIPVVPTAQVGFDCSSGLHVIYNAAGSRFFPEKKFGESHERCGLATTAKEMFLKHAPLGKRMRWTLESPARRALAARRLNALNEATRVTAISKTLAKLLQKNGVQKKIDVVPQPVEERFFAIPPKEASTKKSEKKILFLGGKSWLKGYPVLLEAFASTKLDAKLVVAGPIEYDFNPRIVSAWESDSRIEFRGMMGRERLSALYAEADVVVFPSLCIEAMGRVWAEACAAQRAVIALFARGGAADYLVHGKSAHFCGHLIESLAEGLEKTVSDDAYRERLARNGRDFAETNFHIERVVDALENAYAEAVA